MLIPIKQMHVKNTTSHEYKGESFKPAIHSEDIKPREGEFVIMKEGWALLIGAAFKSTKFLLIV